MKFTPYFRQVPGAKSAALFVHGILGTPAHFKDLLPVVPEDWSIYNILLDGHGRSPADFAHSSMKKWKAQVSAQVEEILQTHEEILIVAHSMGTFFAIDEAIKQPDRIKALFLLAVPLKPRVLPSTAINSLRVAFGRIKPGSPAEAMYNDAGVELTPYLWKYISWIPRFLELFMEVRRTISKLPLLSVPAKAFQSYTDELVGRKSIRLLTGFDAIQLTVLKESGHFCYSTADTQLLQTQLKETVSQIVQKAGSA